MFESRNRYRSCVERKGLVSFTVTALQTNLQILAERDLKAEATEILLEQRGYIENFIENNNVFATTLSPFHLEGPAPEIIRKMVNASSAAGVGPMAAVAGALAEAVGLGLCAFSDEVIVENGGDTFISVKDELTVAIAAGKSPLDMKIGLRFKRTDRPFSVCTSSGTVGHSISFGKADAVCIVSSSSCLADAAATSVGNMVKKKNDINRAISYGRTIDGVEGIVVVIGSDMGAWGDVELVRLIKKA